MTRAIIISIRPLLGIIIGLVLSGCANTYDSQNLTSDPIEDVGDYDYLIGPGDQVQVFVWRNPEVSQTVAVRPDGKITTPLVEDLVASGKTSSQLARDIEKVLETYIRQPIVTVIVGGFNGQYDQQIRVVGEATTPQALPYKRGMSLLDVMIAVGGLTEFAAGNKASIVRGAGEQQQIIPIRIADLLEDGEIRANVSMRPGDILVIPESWL